MDSFPSAVTSADMPHNVSRVSAMVDISSSLIASLLNAAKTSTPAGQLNQTSPSNYLLPSTNDHFLLPSTALEGTSHGSTSDFAEQLANNVSLNAAMTSAISGMDATSPTFDEPPVEDWCFDLIVFYRSIAEDDAQALNVLRQLETYSKFSFVVNGLMTCLLASFGLLGNALFVSQLYKSRYFSRRLALHLSMLCVWDMALLLCCLLTYGIMASYYGILPFVGIVAYLLYFFQPFASFCVTGTIWQVLAITVERYTAVSRPLEQRTRNAQFSLRTICFAIAAGAFLLNMVVVPFERRLTNCYEFTQNGYRIRTMIVQQDLVNNQYYAILAHLVPDIIFRAPTPIIIIAILTVRTLQICARRTVGTQTIHQARRNVPFMLTLLNIKFIMCNTLYMFNTILMEVMGYGGKTSNQQTELEMEEYVKSLYLTDFSNMLLAIHSATNWLIFYHWPRCTKHQRRKKLSSLTLTSNVVSKGSSISINCTTSNFVLDANIIEALADRFAEQKYFIATKILVELCLHSEQISRLLLGATAHDAEFGELLGQSNGDCHSGDTEPNPTSPSNQRESLRLLASSALNSAAGSSHCEHIVQNSFAKNSAIQTYSKELGDLIEKVLNGLANKSSIFEWRDMCRRIGYANYKINLYFSAGEWKLVRNILVQSMGADVQCTAYGYHGNNNNNTNAMRKIAAEIAQRNSPTHFGGFCCYKKRKCDLKETATGYKSSKISDAGCKNAHKMKKLRNTFYANNISTAAENDAGISNLQRAMLKAFNFALREMKSGALCAIVDNSRCNHQRTFQPQRSLIIGRDAKKYSSTTNSIEHLNDHHSTGSTKVDEENERSIADTVSTHTQSPRPSKTVCHLALSDYAARVKNVSNTIPSLNNHKDSWKISCNQQELFYLKRKDATDQGESLPSSLNDPL